MTHVVVPRFIDGREERHKIGRRLLSRHTGEAIIVESARIEALG